MHFIPPVFTPSSGLRNRVGKKTDYNTKKKKLMSISRMKSYFREVMSGRVLPHTVLICSTSEAVLASNYLFTNINRGSTLGSEDPPREP